MFVKTAVVALFAAVAAAQKHQPVGDPSGNPISRPSLNEQVPKGQPFVITWAPTTTNPISIVLRKGPSENNVIISTIVEGIANSGTFTWTPSPSLETTGDRFYGVQIIDDVNGQYQYSTQFGLTGETVSRSTPTATVIASVTGGYPTPTATISASVTGGYPIGHSSSINSTLSGYPTTKPVHTLPSSYPVHNSTIVQPTKTPSVPATLKTSASETASGSPSATTSLPAQSTGGAAGIKAGLSFAGLMAVAAAFL